MAQTTTRTRRRRGKGKPRPAPVYVEPAASVIAAIGGVGATADLLGLSDSWVYRWQVPETVGGTGGRIPAEAKLTLVQAAMRGEIAINLMDILDE